MKEEEWIKRLRDHLADYEAPVPDDLWERIEARLPKELVTEKPKARTIPLWVRWTAAAALVGVLIGTTALLWPSHEEAPMAPMASATKDADKIPDGVDKIPMKSDKTIESESVNPAAMSPVITKMTQPVVAEAVDKPQSDTTSLYIKEVETQVAEVQPQQTTVEPAPAEELPKMEPSQQQLIRELDEKIAEYKTQRSHHATVSLYASNGFGNLTNRNGVLMSEQMLANYDYDSRMGVSSTRSGSPVYLANYEERQKYHQPISFGLTANFPISSVLSVSSGVVYTRLSSDFTNIANSFVYEKKMTLHYIGIPLNVQYRVWQWHGLNVYATAGGQADFNVKVRLEADGLEQEMEKDRVQWSVGGALGVQYNIIPQLGLYAEPGIKYYFDNGSHIRNYFKYRPTNFNLQIGLRLNMGKP
jgi:hypothetical protein